MPFYSHEVSRVVRFTETERIEMGLGGLVFSGDRVSDSGDDGSGAQQCERT